jgi:hypothetical protein
MTQRRALSDLLIDIADGVLGFSPPPGLRATAMEVALPVDIEMVRTTTGTEFRCEVPRFVTRTSFDKPPSRVTVRWVEEFAP